MKKVVTILVSQNDELVSVNMELHTSISGKELPALLVQVAIKLLGAAGQMGMSEDEVTAAMEEGK